MPKFKQSTLSALIDSDSDDAQFVDAMPTPDSAVENKPPGKKTRGRPKVAPAKVTKTKAPARRTSGRLIAKAKAQVGTPTKGKRQALKDKTNQQHASEMEMDDFTANDDVAMDGTEIQETQPAEKATKSKVTKKKAVGARSKAVKEMMSMDHSIEDTTLAAPEKVRITKRKAPAKKDIPPEPSPEKVIMETQVQQMEINDADEDEEIEETISKPPKAIARPRSQSRPRPQSAHRRRAGSASDTERNDPALRRKLGEVTKKYENLQLKYSDLREVGLKEAERNAERFKKGSEEKTKSASISSRQ
jgi:hypothetical protein